MGDYLAEVARELEPLPSLFDSADGHSALAALSLVFLSRHQTSAQMQQLSFQESRHLSDDGREALSRSYHDRMVRPVAALLDKAAEKGWIRRSREDEPAAIWIFLGLLSAFLQPGHEGRTPAPSTEAFVRLLRNTLQGDSAC